MRPRRWNEFFALFFDPTVPVTFIVGSLAIAVAGSALYTLLSEIIGTDTPSQIQLFLGSLAIVIISVFVLRQAVRFWIRHQSKGILIVPENEQAQAHKSLILPIGVNPIGAERGIIHHHARHGVLRHCWLLVTPQVETSAKLGELRQYLLESNVEPHILRLKNAHQVGESYAATLDAVRVARATRDAWPLIADITAGTAVMSVGIALAAREQGVSIQYYPAIYQADTGSLNPDSASAPLLVAFVTGQDAS